MKVVSFEVAKALKDAGYPQDYGEGSMYYSEDGVPYEYDSELAILYPEVYCGCQFVMDAWLWLWREKGIRIKDTYDGAVWVWTDNESSRYIEVGTKDPEEAIASSIEYLVNENLLK